MTNHATHIVLAGGGTGGHLFPGLAVAEQLADAEPDWRITFAGSGSTFERSHVERAGHGYATFPCHALPRSPWDAVRFVTSNWAGYRSAARFLRDEQVSLVIGLGGYVSVPMGRAAVARRVPLVLIEQNVVPGRATSWLAPSASLICTAFDESRAQLRAHCPIRVTGNPIRRGPAATALPRSRVATRSRQLLVLGGSRGATQLNQLLPPALYKAGATRRDWKIVHQTGPNDVEATKTLYAKLGLRARVASFLPNVRGVLAESDLVVSRAGASTLAELAVARVPAILLPYPYATDHHQRRNAEVFERHRAARLFDPAALTGRADNHLASLLTELFDDAWAREQMGKEMGRLAHPQAAWHVASMVRQMLPSGTLSHAG